MECISHPETQRSRPLHSSGCLDTPANLTFQTSLSVFPAEFRSCLPQSLQSTACPAPTVCCRWWEPPVIPHSHKRKALPPPCSGGSGREMAPVSHG